MVANWLQCVSQKVVFSSILFLLYKFVCSAGFEESEGPRAGRAHAGGNRTVWKEGSASPERDAGRQGDTSDNKVE